MVISPSGGEPAPSKKGHIWDALGCLIALIYALPSLALPFGRDQGAFWYVARAWREGGLPYVTAIDHKPPAIYGVFALAQALFGETMWGIRLLELLAIVPLAYLILLVALPDKPRPKGALGLSAMLFSALYFQTFGFWHSAQSEFWEGGCLLLALVCARQGRALLCGASVAQACLFKLTAVIPGLLPFFILLKVAYDGAPSRPWRALTRAFFGYFKGGLGLVALWMLPFALGGGLEAVWDTVIVFNIEYAQREDINITTASELWDAFYPIVPAWVLLGVLLFGRGWLMKRAPAQVGVMGLFVGLCILSVLFQGKFFTYHWVVVAGGVVAVMLRLFVISGGISGGRGLMVGGLMLALAWFGGTGWSGSQMTYRRHSNKILNQLMETGVAQSSFLIPYHGPDFYRPSAVYGVSRFIEGVMKPGYSFCAEGFEPVFYVELQVRCPSPFFAQHILKEASEGGRWDGWRQRHQQVMDAHPPDVIIRNHVQEEMELSPPGPEEPYEFLYAQGTYSVLRRRGSAFAK